MKSFPRPLIVVGSFENTVSTGVGENEGMKPEGQREATAEEGLMWEERGILD